MEDQIKEVLSVAKTMAKLMQEDKELITITAKLSMTYLKAYIDAGFTRKEAVKIVAALSAKN